MKASLGHLRHSPDRSNLSKLTPGYGPRLDEGRVPSLMGMPQAHNHDTVPATIQNRRDACATQNRMETRPSSNCFAIRVNSDVDEWDMFVIYFSFVCVGYTRVTLCLLMDRHAPPHSDTFANRVHVGTSHVRLYGCTNGRTAVRLYGCTPLRCL